MRKLIQALKQLFQDIHFCAYYLREIHTLLQNTDLSSEPKFTCYYCNNHFPKSQQVRIANYSYCEEHANRGHSIRTN